MELVDMNSLGLFDFFNFIRSSRIYLIFNIIINIEMFICCGLTGKS
jgi:hypothetical protein